MGHCPALGSLDPARGPARGADKTDDALRAGDAAAGKVTFPLRYGTENTRWLCIALWVLVALMYAGGVLRWGHISEPASWAIWATPFPGWAVCMVLLFKATPHWKALSRSTLATLILGIVQCLWVPMI